MGEEREGGKEGVREGRREGGKEGRRERGREGGRVCTSAGLFVWMWWGHVLQNRKKTKLFLHQIHFQLKGEGGVTRVIKHNNDDDDRMM